MSGPPDYFERYLLRRGWETVRLDHPLDSYEGRASVLTHDGKPMREWKRSGGGVLSLMWDFLATVRAALRTRSNVAVGANNFDTYGILTARRLRLRRTPRVIYFAADYSEDRFANRLMNWIYLRIERSVLRRSDVVVSNTRRAERKRLELGLDVKRSVVIPNGVLLEHPTFKPKRVRKDNFVFVGSVTREHGLYELLEAMRPLIGHLAIIGHGEDWDRVLGLCERQGIALEAHQNRPHEWVLEFLAGFEGFGLAPYNRESKWTYYCSPLKINEYVASGLPVITSSVPEIAETITAEKLGIVYDVLDGGEVRRSLDAFDPTDFHQRAESFYDRYNSDTLYGRVPL
jgi:glycosyltransferase involved in cell wall biosynthesis